MVNTDEMTDAQFKRYVDAQCQILSLRMELMEVKLQLLKAKLPRELKLSPIYRGWCQ